MDQSDQLGPRVSRSIRATVQTVFVCTILAIVKIGAGWIGHSYALIADGVESILDIFSSLVVWGGLRIASIPPDRNHPYGHGKAESLAAMVVASGLLAAALGIAVQSVREIITPHRGPAPFTLVVLLLVVAVKEALFRRLLSVSRETESSALQADAWHHRSDALTSAAAFVGISVALLGGEGYASADDWAALLACGIIAFNGARMLRIKSGPGWLVDIHVEIDGSLSVDEGHAISHRVKARLCSSDLRILDVLVHIEPTR